MFQVKAEVTFFTDLYEQWPCRANIKLVLPIGPDSHGLPLQLISPSRILLEESLHADWGYEMKNGNDRVTNRYRIKSLFAGSWSALQQQIDELISDVVDTLNKTIEHNRLLLATQPNNYQTKITVG